MTELKELFQNADWKAEKHVPVIDAPSSVNKGEFVKVTATVGKEISHPNKTEHHIRWIEIFFLPDGDKFPIQIGRADFSSHGESAKGPDMSGVYTHHEVTLNFKTDRSGAILAASYCNIHGLWQNAQKVAVDG